MKFMKFMTLVVSISMAVSKAKDNKYLFLSVLDSKGYIKPVWKELYMYMYICINHM